MHLIILIKLFSFNSLSLHDITGVKIKKNKSEMKENFETPDFR